MRLDDIWDSMILAKVFLKGILFRFEDNLKIVLEQNRYHMYAFGYHSMLFPKVGKIVNFLKLLKDRSTLNLICCLKTLFTFSTKQVGVSLSTV